MQASKFSKFLQKPVKDGEEILKNLQSLRASNQRPVAVVVSDIHLRQDPPRARRSEPNWFAIQAKYLQELSSVANQHKVPVICTGDIFDDGWRVNKCSPELINFAIDNLPHMYAVAGNHDLPNHNIADLHKSALYTLVQAGKVTLLKSEPFHLDKQAAPIQLTGFSYGVPIKNVPPVNPLFLNIAVIHHYIWCKDRGHIKADKKDRVEQWYNKLSNYDVALFGDNHKGFIVQKKNLTIVNAGGFMRFTTEEENYKPFIVILYEDGSAKRHYLDISSDVFDSTKKVEKASTTSEYSGDYESLIETLKSASNQSQDIQKIIFEKLKKLKVPEKIKNLVLESIGGHNGTGKPRKNNRKD